MTITVVTDPDALAALGPAWRALWARVPDATPFAAPEWLLPWWQAFGAGHRLNVAVSHHPGGLHGVVALYRYQDKLLPLGVGISDYCDPLIAPDAPAGTAAALLAAALAAGGAARCDLPDQTGPAPAAPFGWRLEQWPGPPCPVLDLKDPMTVGKGMRRDVRQARNRAGRVGGWTVERATTGTYAALAAELAKLHRQRWSGRNQAGVLADPAVQAFHASAGPGLIDAGLLRLEALSLEGVVSAAIYALLSPGRIYFYLSGFTPGAAYQSPGTILLSHMVEAAREEGRTEAHFLRGGEAYKYAWGAVDRHNTGYSLVRG